MRINASWSIPEAALTESFVRSSGPGGQNVNKVATAVELRLDLAVAGLPAGLRARAAKLAGRRLSTDGVIVIHAHEHRTQQKNREAARQRLIDLLTKAARRPRFRKPTKPSVLAREKRLVAKHHRSEIKRARAGSDAD